MSGPCRALAAVALALLAAREAAGHAAGSNYGSCVSLAGHGTNNAAPGAFTVTVADSTAGGAIVTTWTAGHSYRVTLAGGNFRGFQAAAFVGAAAPSAFSAAKAGAMAPAAGDVGIVATSECAGTVTQTDGGTTKTTRTWTWTPPAAGTGAVTLWTIVVVTKNGANYRVFTTLQEAAAGVSPTASMTPSLSATLSLTPTPSQTVPAASASSSPTTSFVAVPSSSSSPTPTPTPSPTSTISTTPSGTVTPTASLSGGASVSSAASASPTPSPTASPTATVSTVASVSASATPTPSGSPTSTATPSGSRTVTGSPTASVSPTSAPTPSPSASPLGGAADLASAQCSPAAGTCAFPLALRLSPRIALAWRIDAAAGLLHLQLACSNPTPADEAYCSVAFNSAPLMPGADGFVVEPGQVAGSRVTRIAINGYSNSDVSPRNDAAVLVNYASFVSGNASVLASLAAAAGSSGYPAAALLADQGAGPVVYVASFSRHLTAAPPLSPGTMSLDVSAPLWIVACQGLPGLRTMGAHLDAVSVRVNLRTGLAAPELSAALLAAHYILSLAGFVLLPLAALAVRLMPMCARVGAGRGTSALAKSEPSLSLSSSQPLAPWRRAHAELGILGAAAATAGLAVGIVATPRAMMLMTLHGVTGVAAAALVALLLVQSRFSAGAMSVVLTPDTYTGAEATCSGKKTWRLFHAAIGALALVLGIIASYTGSLSPNVAASSSPASSHALASLVQVLLSLSLVCAAVLLVAMRVRSRWQSRGPSEMGAAEEAVDDALEAVHVPRLVANVEPKMVVLTRPVTAPVAVIGSSSEHVERSRVVFAPVTAASSGKSKRANRSAAVVEVAAIGVRD